MRKGKWFWGILGAAALGAILGVLFAPRKGAETRKSISDKGKSILDELNERLKTWMNTHKTQNGPADSNDQNKTA